MNHHTRYSPRAQHINSNVPQIPGGLRSPFMGTTSRQQRPFEGVPEQNQDLRILYHIFDYIYASDPGFRAFVSEREREYAPRTRQTANTFVGTPNPTADFRGLDNGSLRGDHYHTPPFQVYSDAPPPSPSFSRPPSPRSSQSPAQAHPHEDYNSFTLRSAARQLRFDNAEYDEDEYEGVVDDGEDEFGSPFFDPDNEYDGGEERLRQLAELASTHGPMHDLAVHYPSPASTNATIQAPAQGTVSGVTNTVGQQGSEDEAIEIRVKMSISRLLN
ncbi:hypothetical protein ONZ45_g9793 [Pleurotus djamor]|nr:hypothetical protein ONZ45_g9793 [Pleurotus djamor]